MKIHGSLCHIAFVYPHGHTHLPSLSNFIASFKDDSFTCHYPPLSLTSDLKWWSDTLAIPNVTRPLILCGPPMNLGLYVDASTSWGIGIIYGDRWDAWKTIEGWVGCFRDIGWLEGVTLELLIYMMEEQGIRNSHIILHSDNQGLIGAFDKGQSCNFEVNLSIQYSTTVLTTSNISIAVIYIDLKLNPADLISCSITGPVTNQLLFLFLLPQELQPFLIHV